MSNLLECCLLNILFYVHSEQIKFLLKQSWVKGHCTSELRLKTIPTTLHIIDLKCNFQKILLYKSDLRSLSYTYRFICCVQISSSLNSSRISDELCIKSEKGRLPSGVTTCKVQAKQVWDKLVLNQHFTRLLCQRQLADASKEFAKWLERNLSKHPHDDLQFQTYQSPILLVNLSCATKYYSVFYL